ncbi:hypothetical protein IU459_32795 [Nocardia amamiensis]|uniref:Uncharacterized protein n=1 Tax=Nocardia amamiensis TaxID=404578 RepID=A0ABS0D0B5_9NOCA|nr:hypothetical protein [Nocardia amamiensis]MBF6302284.1 hypothetical protein [Nocardia amamiensis]
MSANQEPLDHVLRPSLPWRDEELTECGRPAVDVASAITADDLTARVKRIGQQRTAFTVCMTCAGRVEYSSTWERYPIAVLERELQRAGIHPPGLSRSTKPEAARMTAELRAIAALIEAHREEFDGYLSGLDKTVDLGARRRRRAGGGR